MDGQKRQDCGQGEKGGYEIDPSERHRVFPFTVSGDGRRTVPLRQPRTGRFTQSRSLSCVRKMRFLPPPDAGEQQNTGELRPANFKPHGSGRG